MSWFSPRGSGPRKEQGRVQTEAEPEVHRSLALAALFDDIRRRKMQVLDLGSAVGSNVEFLSQYGCKLFIEDLYAALSTRATGDDGELAGPSSSPSSSRFPRRPASTSSSPGTSSTTSTARSSPPSPSSCGATPTAARCSSR